MRGRLPRPAAEKHARGNPGKRKIAEPILPPVEAVAPSSALSAPEQLKPLARQVWGALAPRLEEMRFLRSTDLTAFARYCSDLAQWWACQVDIETRGLTYMTSSKHVKKMERINPKFLVQERLERRLVNMEDRFGMSPAARQRLMLQLAATVGGLPLNGAKPKPEGDTPSEGAQPADGSLGLAAPGPLVGGLNAGSRAIN